MKNKEIGIKFKRIRESRNKTVEEFAAIVGTNKSTWSRIENGQKKTLSYEEIAMYCKNGNINISDIYGTNFESFGNNQTKSIKALVNNAYHKNDFFKYFMVFVIFSSLYAALYTTSYTSSFAIIIWVFFVVSYLFSNVTKEDTVVPTINYSIKEYPYLINSLSEEELKKEFKLYQYFNVYILIVFFFNLIFLIGRFNEMIQTDELMFITLFSVWSMVWESAIVFDFNASKFFTKIVFYEGSEKHFASSKLRISIINNGVLLFSYLMLEIKYSSQFEYLKLVTAFLIVVLCGSNWIRYEIKNKVSSKYALSFNKNPSLK